MLAFCDKLCEFTRTTSVKLFLRLMETIFIFVCNSVTLIAECTMYTWPRKE